MLEQPLEGIADVARRQPAAVVECDVIAQAETIAGRSSEEMSTPPGSDQAPDLSWAMLPESRSERTSSFVKKGFPSVASRSLRASSGAIWLPPVSVERKAQ